jgi:tetratricopeptide (TPR) repeat protein
MARVTPWLTMVTWLLAAGVAAQAEQPGQAQQPAPDNQPAPDKQRAAIDRLLDALKTAPDEQAAAMLEEQVQQIWLHAGTPAVTLLMSRGVRSLRAGETDEAVDSLSDAITLQPDAAEAWHQRAIARYHAGDVTGAIRDLEETVRLEPRNFAAFRTLAEISASREDWKGAYVAWQKVLEFDPKTPGGEERLRVLRKHALGEDT